MYTKIALREWFDVTSTMGAVTHNIAGETSRIGDYRQVVGVSRAADGGVVPIS
jgi:hypothetical protein